MLAIVRDFLVHVIAASKVGGYHRNLPVKAPQIVQRANPEGDDEAVGATVARFSHIFGNEIALRGDRRAN